MNSNSLGYRTSAASQNDITLLQNELNKWVNSELPNAQSKSSIGRIDPKVLAVERIKAAYQLGDQEIVLDLKGLDLKSLPDIFGIPGFTDHVTELNVALNNITTFPPSLSKLTKLKILNVEGNQMDVLPETIRNFKEIENIYLNGNSIKTLPHWIGELTQLNSLSMVSNKIEKLPDNMISLSKLKVLCLVGNSLTELPDWIGNLTSLEYIDFSNNELSSVPSSIGNLSKLSNFSISGNSRLSSLPISLGNCSLLTEIPIEDTEIPEHELDAILALTQETRDATGVISLPSRLEDWKALGCVDYDFSFLTMVPENIDEEKKKQIIAQQAQISEWLLRLGKTNDFSRERVKLAKTVCDILLALEHQTTFREAFFVLLNDNLAACGDRSAMLLNMIYTEWKLNSLSEDAEDGEKIALLEGVAKTLTLRKILQEMIFDYELKTGKIFNESVEIYLYYETTLKKELKLITAIDHMLHEQMGDRSDIVNTEILLASVDKEYRETLTNFSSLNHILEKNTTYGKDYVDKREIIITEAQKKSEGVLFDSEQKTLLLKREKSLIDLRMQYVDRILGRVR